MLDWHHTNLRRGSSEFTSISIVSSDSYQYILSHGVLLFFSVGFIFNNTVCLAFGIPVNPVAAAKGEKLLSASLARIESFWLQEDGPFLLGNAKPTIADLALVCEIMQLEVSKCVIINSGVFSLV